MLFKNIYTLFLLYIPVLKCENIEENEEVGFITNKYGNTTELRLPTKEASNQFQQLQLVVMRAQLNRQNELLTKVMDRLNKLNEKCNKSTSLEPIQFSRSCAEAAGPSRRSDVYQIVVPSYSQHPFIVSCDEETQGGGWTTMLRREDGTVNFYLFWEDYKRGFGRVTGEFFIGLEKLHFMTIATDQELLITMENAEGDKRFAKYDRFVIGGEKEAFKLISLGEYSGNAGDSLESHLGRNFTTRDYDYDKYNEGNCAQHYTGGWWYNNCHSSNLMGKYNDKSYGKGVIWYSFTGDRVSLKRVQMMIRPRRDRKSS